MPGFDTTLTIGDENYEEDIAVNVEYFGRGSDLILEHVTQYDTGTDIQVTDAQDAWLYACAVEHAQIDGREAD